MGWYTKNNSHKNNYEENFKMFLNTIVKILDFSQVFAENNFGKGDAGVKKFTLRNGLTTKCWYKHFDVFNLDTPISTLLSRFHQIVAKIRN